ncbi:hypothetical protein SCB49_06627 [unidentified eubacterium SCB49]|nr:hypothetical protein SCB49_06627 [unidentified eubacterium SCB49]
MDIQLILVIITFIAAVSFILYTFVFKSMLQKKKRALGTLDGGKTKCGNNDCACH